MPFLNSLSSTFPAYILPSVPFRRRSSTSTTQSASSDLSSSPTSPLGAAGGSAIAEEGGPSVDAYLTTQTSLLRCNRCLAQIASTGNIISKGFTGRHGRAYLVSHNSSASTQPAVNTTIGGVLPNTNVGKPQQRQLVTGLHTVCDISCALCGSVLGWKYVAAEEEGQKYKVGKFILETKRVMRDTVWDGDCDSNIPPPESNLGGSARGSAAAAVEEGIEFDSQDEDECEDLFMGIWSEKLASKRRKDRAWRMEN